MTLWCVIVGAHGAHEAECVYSVWTSKGAADAEAERLNLVQRSRSGFTLGCYGGDAYVAEIQADVPSDAWIE